MIFVRTESFLNDFRSLPNNIQNKVEKVLRLLANNLRHPSLQIKKMQPKTLGIFEIRVTLSYRMTCQVEQGRITLRRIGTHNILRTP